jgi:hypothetical protein
MRGMIGRAQYQAVDLNPSIYVFVSIKNKLKQSIISRAVAVRVVVAIQDAEQLHRLVQSIDSMTQHHLVILHIERQSRNGTPMW